MARKVGRPPGPLLGPLPEAHRLKIQNSKVLKYLLEHVEGGREMSSTQVTAGVALLKKVMPDLAAIEHSGEVKQTYIVSPELPNDEWEKEFVTRPLDS